MRTEEKLQEVEKRLEHCTSWKCRNDLRKYKQRLLKELRKERVYNGRK